jgi:hypothetical protein
MHGKNERRHGRHHDLPADLTAQIICESLREGKAKLDGKPQQGGAGAPRRVTGSFLVCHWIATFDT